MNIPMKRRGFPACRAGRGILSGRKAGLSKPSVNGLPGSSVKASRSFVLTWESRSQEAIVAQNTIVVSRRRSPLRCQCEERLLAIVNRLQLRPVVRIQIFVLFRNALFGSNHGLRARGEADTETAITLAVLVRAAEDKRRIRGSQCQRHLDRPALSVARVDRVNARARWRLSMPPSHPFVVYVEDWGFPSLLATEQSTVSGRLQPLIIQPSYDVPATRTSGQAQNKPRWW